MILDDWILIQRKASHGTIGFNTNWNNYVNGFGNQNNNYWIGLRKMHNLTTVTPHRVAIDIWFKREDHVAADTHRQFTFDSFAVGDADTNYALYVDGGDANNTEQLWKFVEDIQESNSTGFSTHDRDNDSEFRNCANFYNGGWWYNKCESNSFPCKMYRRNDNIIEFKMKITPKPFK